MASSPYSGQVAGLVALATALAAFPVLTDDFRAYQLGTYLLHGVAAQGLALIWGRLGMLSLGQALFFGTGAYVAALILSAAKGDGAILALLPLVVLGPALLAHAIGRLVFARRYSTDPGFTLITLALTMLGSQVAGQWTSVTGGFNGLSGVPEIPGLDRYGAFYYLVAAVTLGSTALMVWLYGTPLGQVWKAIARNENRLQFLGYDTPALKALAFGLSAALTGLAGGLYAVQQGLVTPHAIGFQLSAELVLWTAVGGRFGPYGALLGAVGIGMLSAELRDLWADWEIVTALLFIAAVLWFPAGLAGIGDMIARRSPKLRALPDPGRAMPAPPVGARPRARLRFSDVSVRIGDVRILDGLDLDISEPGIHCIIGPNGAGKTSTFNALTGRLPLTGGRIEHDGTDVGNARADQMARRGIGRKFQVPSVFAELAVRENLLLALWGGRLTARDYLGSMPWRWSSPLLDFLESALGFLRQQASIPASDLSQGQRQMLELAMTLLTEPRLMLLDEPCAGLSPAETLQQTGLIAEAVRLNGATVLLIEHDMAAVERLANHVHVLHQGRHLFSGDLAQVRANRQVQAVYAGGSK